MLDLGFQGKRLTQARKVRNLTQKSLAQKIGRTSQSVSQYESGAIQPSDDVARKIAEVLDVPISLLYKPWVSPGVKSPVFYRSLSAATKRARDAAEGKLEWIDDCVAYFEKVLDIPRFSLPDIDIPENPMLITESHIENAAKSVRAFWGIPDGPIRNVIGELEKHGAFVFLIPLGADTLDALSVRWNTMHPYIIVGTDQGSACRWRFDVAHELGHLVLHKDLDVATVQSSDKRKLVEQQAHRFASAFLLPEDPFLDSLYSLTLDGFKSIKPYWKVSISAMIRRSKDLGIIDDAAYQRLCIGMTRRKWRREEPFDNELSPERPALARKCFSVIGSSFDLSEDDFKMSTGLPNDFVDDILGGYRVYESRDPNSGTARVFDFESIAR